MGLGGGRNSSCLSAARIEGRIWISSGAAGRSKSGAEVRLERGGAAREDGSERASLDTSQSFGGSHRLFAGGGLLQTLL